MSVKIGIDLGTTNTLVMAEQKGKLKNIKFSGSNNLPSVVCYSGAGEIVVGEKAKQRGITLPKRVISSAKTYMGDFTKHWDIDGKHVTPTMVATEVLKEVKEKVLKKLKLSDDEVVEAVITVPAYFTSNQKDETKKAASNAGIHVLKIITEPVAAAIAYGLDLDSKEKLFIFDLGGGTFDVAVLEADPQKDEYYTISLDGDKKLGGDDFDIALQNVFIKKIKEDTGIDLSSYEKSQIQEEEKFLIIRSKLLQLAEKTKISLSETNEVLATENYLFTIDNNTEYHFEMTVTRGEFYQACKGLIQRIRDIIERCLSNKDIAIQDIDKVVMVGGSSNLTFVYDLLQDIFQKPPYSNLDVGNLVVNGATIVATSYDGLGNSNLVLEEHISHSLGVEIVGQGDSYSPILRKGSSYREIGSGKYTTDYDYQESVMINVYEGEDKDVNNNEFYGGFELVGIERAVAGVPQIQVTFAFDQSGILVVTAEDMKTGAKKEVKITKGEKKEQAVQKSDIALLMDLSGSMSGNRIKEALKAGRILVDELLDLKYQQLGVVGFATRSKIISSLSDDKNVLSSSITELENCMNRNELGGGTNMREAIRLGIEVLKYSNNQKVMILVTDGEDGSESRRIASDARNQGIELYAVGVAGADRQYLRELTGTKDRIYMLKNINELQKAFKSIVNGLARR